MSIIRRDYLKRIRKMKNTILNGYHFPILRFGTNKSVKLVEILEEIKSATFAEWTTASHKDKPITPIE